tara:strand:- start:95 stop:394 length:300 start_codon:yes stop_codon:yes gene_type:complete
MPEYALPSHHRKCPIPYPNNPPAILAMLHRSAKYSDLFLAPNAKAISNTSGGMGKKEDSANASKNSTTGPYGVSDQWRTQSYNFRIIFMSRENSLSTGK